MEGGRRRVDRVLAADFVMGLTKLSIEELRERRGLAEQEEVDLSYLRRMLHGRIDLVNAERARRAAGGAPMTREELIAALADHEIDGKEEEPNLGENKFNTLEPSRADEHRRQVERALANAVMSDVASREDVELDASLTYLSSYESEVGVVRDAVHVVVEIFGAEIARRYREGLISVDSLLETEK